MNGCFLGAAALAFAVGLVHTVLGERLIFRRMRRGGFIPTDGGTVLREPHVRILWASWHVVTVFGWGLAVLLGWLAVQPPSGVGLAILVNTIVVSMLAAAILVFVGTKARHPGWGGLLGVAVLTWLGGQGG